MDKIQALENLYTQSRRLSLTGAVDDDFPEVMHDWHGALKTVEMAEGDAEYDEALSLGELAAKQFDWVERMGWHNKTVLEALALIGSEVGEAVNECRGDEPTEKLGEELADIILRTLDLAKWLGLDIEGEVLKKMAVNEVRGTRGRRI